jgi:hypothetical protein
MLSYSAVCHFTAASGKLLPTVFICLHERLRETFFVTVTKPGELQNDAYEHFLDNVIKAICEES